MTPKTTGAGSAALRTCPSCGQDYPTLHFTNLKTCEYHTTCRACRNRERARINARARALKEQHLRRLRQNITRREREVGRVTAHIIKTQFHRAVGPHKTRLRLLQEKENPAEKTLAAIAARQTIIARYERAYEAQKDMLKNGMKPKNIHDMV